MLNQFTVLNEGPERVHAEYLCISILKIKLAYYPSQKLLLNSSLIDLKFVCFIFLLFCIFLN